MVSVGTLRRWPFLILTLLLLLLLAALAAFWLNRTKQPSAAEFASWFPQRDATVFYLDVGVMRASGVLDKLVGSTVGEDPEYRSFIAQTGFDYKRDLNRVMLNSAGGVHYFILQGRFDWSRLRKWAVSQGGACSEDYCRLKGSTPDRVISWRKLRSDLMALGSGRDESSASLIERREAQPVGFEIPAAPLWLHVPGDALRADSDLPAGTKMFATALKSAERVVFSLGPGQQQDFALNADVVCPSAEQAATLKAQLEGLTQLLTSFLKREQKQPSADDLSGVLTTGVFERAGSHVKGRWVIQRAFLDALAGS